jgi:hypothetical protein
MASLTQGTNTFKVRGKTTAGIWGPTVSFQIGLDLLPPIITNVNILPQAEFPEIKSSHTSFTVDIGDIYDEISGVKQTELSYSRDGTIFSRPVVFEGKQLRHTFENVDIHTAKIYVKVEAEDLAGNRSETIVQRDVIYDGPFDYSGHINKWSKLPGQDR